MSLRLRIWQPDNTRRSAYPSPGVSGLRDLGILGFRNLGLRGLEFRDLEFRDFGFREPLIYGKLHLHRIVFGIYLAWVFQVGGLSACKVQEPWQFPGGPVSGFRVYKNYMV